MMIARRSRASISDSSLRQPLRRADAFLLQPAWGHRYRLCTYILRGVVQRRCIGHVDDGMSAGDVRAGSRRVGLLVGLNYCNDGSLNLRWQRRPNRNHSVQFRVS